LPRLLRIATLPGVLPITTPAPDCRCEAGRLVGAKAPQLTQGSMMNTGHATKAAKPVAQEPSGLASSGRGAVKQVAISQTV
jgi:hypothetical protein